MPNHFHALFMGSEGWPLPDLVKSWKHASTRAVNRRLGRAGPLWQRDYFDRVVRDERHFANCLRYIRRNPAKAGLRSGEFTRFENEALAPWE